VICFDVLGTRKCQNFKFLTKSRFTTNRTCYTLLNFRKNPTGGVSIEMAEPIDRIIGKAHMSNKYKEVCKKINQLDIFIFDGGNKGLKNVTNLYCQCQISHTFDYMRISFPFEALTKIGFLRIYLFNLFSENLNLPRHSFLRRL
jgi:hypothetical protein